MKLKNNNNSFYAETKELPRMEVKTMNVSMISIAAPKSRRLLESHVIFSWLGWLESHPLSSRTLSMKKFAFDEFCGVDERFGLVMVRIQVVLV
jgi:hypothetical protein